MARTIVTLLFPLIFMSKDFIIISYQHGQALIQLEVYFYVHNLLSEYLINFYHIKSGISIDPL